MKSGKQRRAEIKAKRAQKRSAEIFAKRKARQLEIDEKFVRVDRAKLAPNNSYGEPEFARRGYYLDVDFSCKDCGIDEVWTATQQKWWYEVIKGYVYSTAARCLDCRRKERERRNESRRVHFEGLERKRKLRESQ